jgi:hypothetical protein
MEPAGRRSSGFLQVKEFSTGKGIKPHRQVSFLQVKEKRQPTSATPIALSFLSNGKDRNSEITNMLQNPTDKRTSVDPNEGPRNLT